MLCTRESTIRAAVISVRGGNTVDLSLIHHQQVKENSPLLKLDFLKSQGLRVMLAPTKVMIESEFLPSFGMKLTF